MKLPDAIDNIRPSVVQFSVMIKGARKGQQFGSGFIINSDGHVATAAHVVEQANALSSIGHRVSIGLAYPNLDSVEMGNVKLLTMQNCFYHIGAEVIAMDVINDVALLKMNPNPFDSPTPSMIKIGDDGPGPIPLYKECTTSTKRPRDGESIVISGYPLNSPTLITTAGNLASSWASTERVIINNGNTTTVTTDIYLADVSVNPGNSGGPTYSLEDGCVIGVCTAYQNAPLMYTDQNGGQVEINARPVGINSGLCVVSPISNILAMVDVEMAKHK